MRNRIEATENARLTEDAADVTIWLADGRELNCHDEHALGSVERPMTSAQLSAKSVGLAEPVLRLPKCGTCSSCAGLSKRSRTCRGLLARRYSQRPAAARLLCSDVCRAGDLAELRDLAADELIELLGTACYGFRAEVGQPGLHIGKFDDDDQLRV